MTVNNTLFAEPLMRFGTHEQKLRWLQPAAKGGRLGCYCLTEPGSGSDAMALATTATADGDHFRLNGTKLFITNGEIASQAVVFATVDRSKGYKGVTAFLVDKATTGFRVGKKEHKMGLLASDTCELVLENVRVPREQVLGQVGDGYKVAFTTLDAGRIGIAAQSLGIAQACLDAAKAYARRREQFGKPIVEFQAIQWMLADMATEVDAARLLMYRAAILKAEGARRFTREASMAKLFASEMANRVAYQAVQIYGGSGYIKDFPVERYFRDARATPLYEGTSEIQRLVIARELLKETEATLHILEWFGDQASVCSAGSQGLGPRERAWCSGRTAVYPWCLPDHVPRAAVDDAAVRWIWQRRRHQPTLQVSDGARPDRPECGVRHADLDGLGFR
jgi:alkylation response protein AidB-like acyl-CoA dehydrogenase